MAMASAAFAAQAPGNASPADRSPAAIRAINRFNPDDPDIILGRYLFKDRVMNNPIYFVSGYMDISDAPPNSCLVSNKGNRFTSFFDQDKKYLSYVENAHPVPIPPDAAFARISLTQRAMPGLVINVAPPNSEPTADSTAGGKVFVNDICLPSTLYMLSETPNEIFVQPFLKRWRPYNDFVRFSLSGNHPFRRRLSHVATIAEPVDGSILTAELVHGDEFETVKRLSSTIRVGVKGKGSGRVTAQIIGDSYTQGAFFRDALLKSGQVPGLSLIGLRKTAEDQYDEGRGGWRLDSYFTVPIRPGSSFHSWMHPEGDFRYWGVREFWVTAWKCFRKTAGNAFEPNYSCGRFDFCLPRFDENTGILLQPQPGDVQYDHAQSTFLLFDGNAWTPRRQEDFNWRFDYSKYLAMWGFDAPQFLFVVLGLNDFCNQLQADYSQWDQQITTLKNSYLEARPDGRFAICIPCSSCGILDNAAGSFTLKQNAAMWNFRDHLIKQFDRREQDGFYLVDTAITVDNEYGYRYLPKNDVTIPYAGCPDDVILSVQTGNPHPYNSYPTMGVPIAAFIQAFRE